MREMESTTDSSAWSHHCTFGLLWTAYASTYLLRKPIGVIKISIADDLLVNLSSLAWLDVALLLPYAVIQMFFGGMADQFPAHCTLSVGLLISAFSMFAFGQIDSLSSAICLLVVNGAAQGVCWPSCTKLLSSAFSQNPQKRSQMLGLLGTSALIGGIAGTALAVQLQDELGWRRVFQVPSLAVASIGACVFLLGRVTFNGSNKSGQDGSSLTSESSQAVWKWPGVKELTACVFCLKMVRYALYMWLPVFLEKQLRYSQLSAGWLSTVFEAGGMIGTVATSSIIIPCFKTQTLRVMCILIGFSVFTFLLFAQSSSLHISVQMLLLAFCGAFNCAPDAILAGSVPTEIGESYGRRSGAAVTGFVNGFGSLGAVLEGPLIALISSLYGWHSLSYVMSILSLVAFLLVCRVKSILD